MNIFLITMLILYSLAMIGCIVNLAKQEDTKFNLSLSIINLVLNISLLIWTIQLYIKS